MEKMEILGGILVTTPEEVNMLVKQIEAFKNQAISQPVDYAGYVLADGSHNGYVDETMYDSLDDALEEGSLSIVEQNNDETIVYGLVPIKRIIPSAEVIDA